MDHDDNKVMKQLGETHTIRKRYISGVRIFSPSDGVYFRG